MSVCCPSLYSSIGKENRSIGLLPFPSCFDYTLCDLDGLVREWPLISACVDVAFTAVYLPRSNQTGCRGCTLEPWYFGFPSQQQWMQDSKIRRRIMAKNRMTTEKAPSSRGLASGSDCSLCHTFSTISINSSFTSMLSWL